MRLRNGQNVQRKDINALCKAEASRHDGWTYTTARGGQFKYKIERHSTAIIGMAWTGMSAIWNASPRYGLLHKKVATIRLALGLRKKYWHCLRVLPPRPRENDPFGNKHNMKRFFYNGLEEDNIAGYIEAVLTWGEQVLRQDFDFSSELALLTHYPLWKDAPGSMNSYAMWEDTDGVNYCLIQILLGNFDFVEQYLADDIPTGRPKRWKELDPIKEKLPEYKRLYKEQGYIIAPFGA